MKYILFAIIVCINLNAYSQNLVINGDFEYYTQCPNHAFQIDRAYPWINPNLANGTPDYFNGCDSTFLVGVPNNTLGFRYAHSGVGYAGLAVWTGIASLREYIEGELTTSLLAGETYCVSFYVANTMICKMGTDGIGILFTDTLFNYFGPNFEVLPYQPQVQNPIGNIITDTINWVQIQQTYIATGGEHFITIGNFRNDSMTNTAVIYPNVTNIEGYFYIDDVSITQGQCVTKVEEIRKKNEIIIYPNPSSNTIFIKGLKEVEESFEYVIKDVFGTTVMSGALTEKTIETTSLISGCYSLVLSKNKQLKYQKRFIVIK